MSSHIIGAEEFMDNWLHPGEKPEILRIYLASDNDLSESLRALQFSQTL